MATLAVYRGDQLDRRVELGEGATRIGRAPENELVLEDRDKGVSRAHAEIRFERGRYFILDLNSQNGVWFGDRRIKREAIPVDTPVTIGPYRIVIESDPSAAPTSDAAATDVAVPVVDMTLVEPTQTSHPALPMPVNATPPPTLIRGPVVPRLALIAGAVVVAAIVVGVVLARPWRSRPVPPPPPVTMVQPATPTPEDQFVDHLTKARAFILSGDKAGARLENDQARKLNESDPRGLEQKVEIDRMSDPVPTVEAPPEEVAAAPDNPELPKGTPTDKTPAVAEFLRVTALPKESRTDRAAREKMAKNHLDDAQESLEKGNYQKAIDLIDAAVKLSGRDDFGNTRNQARDVKARAQAERARLEAEKKKSDARALVNQARAAAPNDIVGAYGLLQKARALDPDAAGVDDLLSSLLNRARADGAEALVQAKNFDISAPTRPRALDKFELAARLFELAPAGHEKDLEYARRRRDEIRAGK